MRVGVEVGGTFTDLVCIDGDGVHAVKVLSTPHAPEIGALTAMRSVIQQFADIEELVHGSTVATNVVLERKGAHLAFITTQGFRDLLFLQRNDRSATFDLKYQKPVPLVRRRDCFEVIERIRHDGSVHQTLDLEDLTKRLLPRLQAGAYDAVAVCLLSAYANDTHEREIARLIRKQLPHLRITCSSDVTREYREYERASTTAISAYVQPVLAQYLERFESTLKDDGFVGSLGIMQSNGGQAPVSAMAVNAVTALYSGPAAGVTGATQQLAQSGYKDLITFDMGGTSTDVCLVLDGQPTLSSMTQIDGLPILSPVIDIVTVGAGGGSIVWRDDGGMLRVGPRSSGAAPGPACYARGGKHPTVTDAHLVRGTLLAGRTLGGELTLDRNAAYAVFEQLAVDFGLDVMALADSAVELTTSNIVAAIHRISTERGYDPRDYVLAPYGGAGPMHAARVAQVLGISRVVMPPNAGVLSAYGLVVSDWLRFETVTKKIVLDEGAVATVNQTIDSQRLELAEYLRKTGRDGVPEFSAALFMRFAGQAFELEVDLGGQIQATCVAELRTRFEAAYQRIFLHGAASDRTVEIVSVRVGVALRRPVTTAMSNVAEAENDSGSVDIVENGCALTCEVRTRAFLEIGDIVEGPAIITDPTSTAFVPPSWWATHDENYNLVLQQRGQQV